MIQACRTHNGFIILLLQGVDAHSHAHLTLTIKVVLEQVGQPGISVRNQLHKVGINTIHVGYTLLEGTHS